MKQITLYTWPHCPYCNKAKQLLDDNGYDYVDIDIFGDDQKKAELTAKTGQRTVPFVFIEDDLLGGCSDLTEVIGNGKFEELVK